MLIIKILIRCSAHTTVTIYSKKGPTVLFLVVHLTFTQNEHVKFTGSLHSFLKSSLTNCFWWCPPDRNWSHGSERWFSHIGPEECQVLECQKLSSEHRAMAVPGVNLFSLPLGGHNSRSGYFHGAELLEHGLAFRLQRLQSWKINLWGGLLRVTENL